MQSPRVRIRASLFPAFTAVAMVLTSCVSITFSLLWQERNESRSIPYISDAHYDLKQSPVFTALIALTGMLFILNTISTYIALCNKYFHACLDHQRCSPESVFKAVCKMSLVLGCVSGTCMILTGALYSDLVVHVVAAITSGSALVLWILSVVAMLGLISDASTISKRIGYRLMISCPVILGGSLIAFVGLRAQYGNESGVIMEYVSVGVTCLFLILLCGQVHSFKLVVMAHEPEDTPPL